MSLHEDTENEDRYCRKRKIVKGQCDDDNSSTDSIEVIMKRDIIPYLSESESNCNTSSHYGLNPNYLKYLGITPPLTRWIFVTNFRCDKSELRDVLELAGKVVICAVITIRSKCAKVMYSHPLEAVQAISMFNGQTFYGQKLKVMMITCPSDVVILPKGLTDVGPGLGIKGKPLREVVKHYKKFIQHEESDINLKLFDNTDDSFFPDKDNEKTDTKKDEMDDSKSSTGSVNKSDTLNKDFKIISVEDLDENSSEYTNKKAKLYSVPSPYSNLDSPNSTGAEKTSSGEHLSKSNELLRKDPKLDLHKESNNQIRPLSNSCSTPMGFQSTMPHPRAPVGQLRPSMGPTTLGPISNIRPPGYNLGPIGPPGLNMNSPVPPGCPPVAPLGPRPMNSGFINMKISSVTNMSMGHTGTPQAPFGPRMPSQILPNPNVVPVVSMTPPAATPNLFTTLLFSNLPPSTTFPLLCEKVSQCGQVMSLQLTTPGCAVAQFAQRSHAERCLHFFNGKCIDGHVIEARLG